MEKKRRINPASFGAGVTAGGLVLVAGALPPLFKGEEGSILRLIICVAIVFAGLALHKYSVKKDTK